MQNHDIERANLAAVIETLSQLQAAEAALDDAVTASRIDGADDALRLLRAAVASLGEFSVATGGGQA
ncbi:MAG: hypothetical protein IT483_15715 [Gammaproteobacteria bacterium]|nr:hypothetical protein [Gammaproteobacteria bacterium]